jgi:hypothetical protein
MRVVEKASQQQIPLVYSGRWPLAVAVAVAVGCGCGHGHSHLANQVSRLVVRAHCSKKLCEVVPVAF